MKKATKKILDDLMYGGITTKDIKLLRGSLTATFKNLTVEGQLGVEGQMKALDGVPSFLLHNYAIKTLSVTLLKYGDKTFNPTEQPGEVQAFLRTLSGVIIDELIKEQNQFEKEIRVAITGKNIEENFSKTGSTEEESAASSAA
tara:strand:- start:1672 stop:2103 length:432 start_codon:yes stop_codon:yes gene_type:complete